MEYEISQMSINVLAVPSAGLSNFQQRICIVGSDLTWMPYFLILQLLKCRWPGGKNFTSQVTPKEEIWRRVVAPLGWEVDYAVLEPDANLELLNQ